MKDVLVRTGSSLLAAVLAYVVLTLLSDSLGTPWKLAIAMGLGIAAFAVSVWAANSADDKAERRDEIASGLKGKSARIDDVDVSLDPRRAAKIASDIDVDGSIEIRGVRVKPTEGKK